MNQIADNIFEQLGGGRFVAMTGTNGFIWDDKKRTLRMVLTKNGSRANRLEIIYNWDDTYTMRFYYYRPESFKIDHKKAEFKTIPEKLEEVKSYEHIYCDQLQELFTEVTGMYTRL